MKTYEFKNIKILGYTTDFQECECCGKRNLKGTISLVDLDTEVILHFGSTCAVNANKYDNMQAYEKAKKEIEAAIKDFEAFEKLARLNAQQESRALSIKSATFAKFDKLMQKFSSLQDTNNRYVLMEKISIFKEILDIARKENELAKFDVFCSKNGVEKIGDEYVFELVVLAKNYHNSLSIEANEIIEMIQEIGFETNIDGNKAYIIGNTYNFKDKLKRLGCKFDFEKKLWFYEDYKI